MTGGCFFPGGQHGVRPEPVAEHLVKAKWCVDAHAWAIRAAYYDQIMEILDRHNKPVPKHPLASDQFVAAAQGQIPTYACYPNLAWQSVVGSDLTGTEYSLYNPGGTQKTHEQALENLISQCVAPETFSKEPKLGLLFLTRGDVNHPGIWKEWVDQAPEEVGVFSHPKFPGDLNDGFLEGTAITEHHETEWAKISLVRASISLLRAALEDGDLTHFVLLSESCVPVKPLREVLFRLKHDPRCQFGHRNFESARSFNRHRARSAPTIPLDCWRFHQQWWLLDRAAAKMVSRNDHTSRFENVFAADEGYFGTVLSMEGYPVDDLVYKKDITWVHWPEKSDSPTSHETLEKDHLVEILHSDALFARKFPRGGDIGKYRLHMPG